MLQCISLFPFIVPSLSTTAQNGYRLNRTAQRASISLENCGLQEEEEEEEEEEFAIKMHVAI